MFYCYHTTLTGSRVNSSTAVLIVSSQPRVCPLPQDLSCDLGSQLDRVPLFQ